MSQESSAEGYSEPNDTWAIGSGDISINESSITSQKKGKISAFGENVISSGRAEWDLQIDFESFGGITIGIYKHSKLTSKNGLIHWKNINCIYWLYIFVDFIFIVVFCVQI